MNRSSFLRKGLAALMLLAPLCGVLRAADDGLPPAIPADRYRPIWTRSPFTVGSSDDAVKGAWALVGLTSSGSGPLVFLLNRQSQERMEVTPEPNAKGYAVLSVSFNPNPLQSTVQIRTPSETLTARFDPALMVVNNPPPQAAQTGAVAPNRPAPLKKPISRTVIPNPSPSGTHPAPTP